MTEEHICKFYQGKIRDVTFRRTDNSIYCRRCGEKLQESEVDPIIFNKIKRKKNGPV